MNLRVRNWDFKFQILKFDYRQNKTLRQKKIETRRKYIPGSGYKIVCNAHRIYNEQNSKGGHFFKLSSLLKIIFQRFLTLNFGEKRVFHTSISI